MRLGIAELTGLVDAPGTTAEVRELVAQELRHRSSPGARRLLARLGDGAEQSGDASHPAGPRVVGAAGEERSPAPRVLKVEMAPHVIERDAILAALRETYTEGSEILARWGVTTAMPADLFDVVVAWWEEVLTDEPDGLGRSVSRLSDDVARIRSLGTLRGRDGIDGG